MQTWDECSALMARSDVRGAGSSGDGMLHHLGSSGNDTTAVAVAGGGALKRQRRPEPLDRTCVPINLASVHALQVAMDRGMNKHFRIDKIHKSSKAGHDSLTYGELLPMGITQLRDIVAEVDYRALHPGNLFLDLGSGVGNIVLGFAA